MKWKINDESCSHVAQNNILIFFFLKRYQVSFLVWGIKKINNMAIKSKRKEKKNHKDKYLKWGLKI